MARNNDSSITHRIAHSKAVRGVEREEYFARPGSTAADWQGGRKQVQIDRRRDAERRACRGKWEE